MGVFPGFGSWINQNTQRPPETESERSENVESKSVSEKDTNNHIPPAVAERKVYYDKDHMMKQGELWHEAEKKHPWHDAPPKVTMEKGVCHMNIELIVGNSPDGVYFTMTDPESGPFFDFDKRRKMMVFSFLLLISI
ncbi:unnamed protein product [Microthlaspi erraticum]|uniref:Uncharacterized protein n=1 Tax=Microthlaspi erraticum TaxID=1685480 RepID=A0A6D2J532_9BRAS|nr:unnamed protein product [Microthlaspi erraticum]